MNNENFELSNLQDFLLKLPHDRKTVEKLLDAIISYDIKELYDALRDRLDFLEPEEIKD